MYTTRPTHHASPIDAGNLMANISYSRNTEQKLHKEMENIPNIIHRVREDGRAMSKEKQSREEKTSCKIYLFSTQTENLQQPEQTDQTIRNSKFRQHSKNTLLKLLRSIFCWLVHNFDRRQNISLHIISPFSVLNRIECVESLRLFLSDIFRIRHT